MCVNKLIVCLCSRCVGVCERERNRQREKKKRDKQSYRQRDRCREKGETEEGRVRGREGGRVACIVC